MSDTYTILIVEDDREFTGLLKRLLRHRKDLSLITADSGRQAIQCLNDNRIDLVLQDIGLPDMDGYQVMDHIHKTVPGILVIVMTGEVTVESAVNALRKGAYDYLRKPFEATDLVNTVDNALARIKLERRHKQDEEKLRESEARYRQLFESESDAVVVFDAETLRFEDVNQAALNLFGYSKQEFLSLMVLDISAEIQKVKKGLELLKKEPFSNKRVPLRYLKKKDGSTFPAEISAGNFMSDKRKKIIGAIRDITIRHQAEEELKRTKQRLEHVLTSSPAVIYSCNPAGDCATTFISENVNRELGYEPQEFLNDRDFWIDRIHPEDVQRVKEVYSNLIEQGSKVLEYRFQNKNGTYRWMRDEVRLFFDDQCKSAEVVGSWTDITDIKRVEKALRESEQQFRDLVESSLIGISIIMDNQFVYQNTQSNNLYMPSNDMSVFKDLENVHPEDLERVKKAYLDIASGAVDKIEINFRFYPPGKFGNDRDIRWVQCRGTAFRYQGKDAVLLNVIDVTKNKLLEHQLIIKNKMLSLGRVAAGIAHEIRNPLTGINTYLYSLKDFCDSDQLGAEEIETFRQILAQIQKASNRIEAVIKRVMDFSKPGAPKMIRTNINKSLEEAIELSSATMRQNDVKIDKFLASDLPECYADPHLIEQVILNLITNAANAVQESNNGDKRIQIKSYAENNTLCIHVADSGPGVPLEDREKIFDPFFTTKEDGSGIGLNIAQRIVADHNGSIALTSSKWGGAEFKIDLPIERRMTPR